MTRLAEGLEECFAWFKNTMSLRIPIWQRVEDVTFGLCSFKLFGTKCRRALGMYHFTPFDTIWYILPLPPPPPNSSMVFAISHDGGS